VSPAQADVNVEIGSDGGNTGDIVTVPVTFTNVPTSSEPFVHSIELFLTYDPAVVKVKGLSLVDKLGPDGNPITDGRGNVKVVETDCASLGALTGASTPDNYDDDWVKEQKAFLTETEEAKDPRDQDLSQERGLLKITLIADPILVNPSDPNNPDSWENNPLSGDGEVLRLSFQVVGQCVEGQNVCSALTVTHVLLNEDDAGQPNPVPVPVGTTTDGEICIPICHVDTDPPTWDDVVGIQTLEDVTDCDNDQTGSLKATWGTATDAESPPVKYNLYYHTASPATDGTKVSEVTSPYTITGLTLETNYYVIVRAEDNAGNEDTNTVEMDETPSCEQPDVRLTIPSVCGAPDSPLTVPVEMELLKSGLEIVSADLTITYDENSGWTVCDPSIEGTLPGDAGDWVLTASIATPGKVEISLFGTTPITASGTLVNLCFTPGGNAQPTDIIIDFAEVADRTSGPLGNVKTNNGKVDIGGAKLTVASGCIAKGTGVDIPVPIPIDIENQYGAEILSVDLSITYDEQFYEARSSSIEGTLPGTAGDWTLTDNIPTPGTIEISLFGVTPITGDGTLIYLNFVSTVSDKNDYGQISDVNMTDVLMQGAGGVELSCVETVDGTLTTSGIYGDVYADGRISSYDASLIARARVGLETLASDQQKRADVYQDGRLSSYDASVVARYRVGLETQLPLDSSPALTTKQDLLRDCYEAIAAPPILPATTLPRNVELRAILPSNAEPFLVQLNVDDASDILASDIILTYDVNTVKFIDVSTTTLTSNSVLVHNALEGKVLVSLYGVKSLRGSGELLNFKFAPVQRTISDIGDAIVVSEIEFNNGEPAANVREQVVSIRKTPTSYRLMQNYPNPFNPETWIPYDLPQATNVVIRIFDVSGRIVRELDLGRKLAGSYLAKAGAAYWDGKNSQGEPVVSGVYYYQLQAGVYNAIKKMVILK